MQTLEKKRPLQSTRSHYAIYGALAALGSWGCFKSAHSEDTKQLMKFVLPHMTGFDWWRIYGAFVGSGQHLIKSGLVVGKCWEDVRFL